MAFQNMSSAVKMKLDELQEIRSTVPRNSVETSVVMVGSGKSAAYHATKMMKSPT